MSLSAREAAEAVGLSRDGILKAIRTGKLSAEKNINGEWRIEPVELFRVYTPVQTQSIQGQQHVDASLQTTSEESTDSLRAQLRLSEQRLADKDDVIADLRARLDAEAEERRRLSLRLEVETEERLKLVVKLTEERTVSLPPPVPAPTPVPVEPVQQPRSWWQRLLGSK